MEKHRFDLGRATPRRKLLKGLLVALAAGVLSRAPAPIPVAAADTCSGQDFRTCMHAAKDKFKAASTICKTTEGPPVAKHVCKAAATAEYLREVRSCETAQCRAGESCINNHCCRGTDCCETSEIFCRGDVVATCCAIGTSCCGEDCCAPGGTCCVNFDLGPAPVAFEVCTDLKTDPKNCGECRNECDDGLSCIDGTCKCEGGRSICQGPLNLTCCNPDETCMVDWTFHVSCVPNCSPCQTYDPNDPAWPCKPKECPLCQACDPEIGECTAAGNGTPCGSGVECCSGQCVNTTCSGAQVFNSDTCQCECPAITCPYGQPDPTTCECCVEPPGGCGSLGLIWDPATCSCRHECDFSPWGCGG